MKKVIIMKSLFIYFSIILLCSVSTFAQTKVKVKGTLYKSDYWVDIKGKGGLAKAYDNPTREY